MSNWYTVKVKYVKQLEDGRLKRVTEPYLVDATSFTEAEARIYEEIGSSVKGEFLISGIAKTDFADIFYYEDCDTWYKCKLSYVSASADDDKEKKITSYALVTANNVKEAYERIHESMEGTLTTFEIPSIAVTTIIEVFPYNPDMDVELERRPATEEELTTGHINSDFDNEDVELEADEFEEEENEEEFDSTLEDENEK